MKDEKIIEGLLVKPLWQMTGEEYCQLTQYAMSLSPNAETSPAPMGQKALGVHALAVELGEQLEALQAEKDEIAAKLEETQTKLTEMTVTYENLLAEKNATEKALSELQAELAARDLQQEETETPAEPKAAPKMHK